MEIKNAVVKVDFIVQGSMAAARADLKAFGQELDATAARARSARRVLSEARSKGGATFGSPGAQDALKKGSKEFKKWRREVEAVNVAIKAQPKRLQHALNNIRTINQAMKKQRNIGIINKEVWDRMGTGAQTYAVKSISALQRVQVRVHVLKNAIIGLSRTWIAKAKQMQWVGRQMIVGISLPLALFASKAISAFRDVEVAQVRFRKVSDVSAEQFEKVWVEKLRGISREFAQTEQITTELAADWAAFGARGESLDMLTEMTSQMALLGDIDLAQATPYVRSVYATFGGQDLEKTLDILEQFNAIENTTALQTKELADALPQVAPVAQQFGMSAAELAASLSAMVEVGLEATESAHGLKFGLQRLLAPTNEAKESIEELFGMDFEAWAFDAEGNAKPMTDLMAQIGLAMRASPDVVEADFMSDVFGKRQVARMTALTTDLADAAEGGDLTSAFATAMEAAEGDAHGVAVKELDAIQKSADFAIRQMKSELKMFMADFGAELIEPFTKLLGVLLKLSKWFSGLSAEVKTGIVALLGFAAVLGPINYVLAQAGLAFSTLLGVAGGVLPSLGHMTSDAIGAMDDLGRTTLAAGDTVYDMGRKFGTAHLPDKVSGVTDGLDDMARAASSSADEVADLRRQLGGVSDDFAFSAQQMGLPAPVPGRAAGEAAEAAGPTVLPGSMRRRPSGLITPENTAKQAKEAAESGAVVSKSFMQKVMDGIKSGALAFWDFTRSMFTKARWEKIFKALRPGELFSKFFDVKGLGGKLLKGLKIGTITAIIAGVILLIKGLIDNWAKVWPRLKPGFDAIKDAVMTLWNAVKDAFSAIAGAFSEVGGGQDAEQQGDVWERVGSIIGAVAQVIAATIEVIAWVIRNIVVPAVRFLAEVITGMINQVINLFSNFADFFEALWEHRWLDAIKAAARVFWDFFFKPVSHVIEAVVDLFVEAIQAMLQAVSGLAGLFNFLPGVEDAGGFADGAIDALQRFQDGSFTHAISDFFRPDGVTRYGDGQREGRDYGDGFEDGIPDDVEGPDVDVGEGEGEEDANEWLSGWLSAVKSSLDEIIGDMMKAAKDALDEKFEANLEVFDLRVEAIEKVEKAEKRLFQTQKYYSDRKDMLRKRDIQKENYDRNRALAIYEGRIDDARMLDLEDRRNKEDHDKSVVDLDESRRRELLDIQRADQKEKINLQKEHEKEKQDILKESFEKQLDIIAEYTPRTVNEMNNMLNAVTSSLWQAGVNTWPGIGYTGMSLFRDAVADANEDIRQDAAWSGDTAATAWLAAFVSGDVQAILAAQGSSPSSSSRAPTSQNIDRGAYLGNYGSQSYYQWAAQPLQRYSRHAPGRSFHTGGAVGGGSPKDVPATLQTGEYIIQRSAVSKVGEGILNRINAGTVPMGGPDGTGAFVAGVGAVMTEVSKGWIDQITAGFHLGTSMVGGFDTGVMAYLFEHLGATVGGTTYDELFPAYGSGAIPSNLKTIRQFGDWISGMFGLSVTSTHRTEAQNRAVGGSPTSDHLGWNAVDIAGAWSGMVNAFKFLIENKEGIPIKQAIFDQRQIKGLNVLGWGGGGHEDHVHIALMEGWATALRQASEAGSGPLKDRVKNYAASQYGWTGDQWNILHELIQRESSWNPAAQNPTSTAWGLFQFLDMHWGPGKYLPKGRSSSIGEQITGGLRYIKDRYGNPSGALRHHDRHNWYHEGGPVEMMMGGKVPYDDFPAMLHRGETVLPQPIAESWEKGLDGDTMGTTVNIYADTFVGDFDYFCSNMKKYDVEVKPRKAMAAGTNVRRINSRSQVNR